MNNFVGFALALVGLISSDEASAKGYVIDVSGKVSSLVGYSNNQLTPPPATQLHIGDALQFRAFFDTSTAELTAYYAADPAVHIYYLPDTKTTLNIGQYKTNYTNQFSSGSSVQLWNDLAVTPTLISDSESFDFFHYNFTSSRPYAFDLGSGAMSEDVQFNNFDTTATARMTDLISEIAPFSAFNSHTFAYVQYNSTLNTFGIVNFDGLSLSVQAIPEPHSWLMMFSGFVFVGSAMRRKSHSECKLHTT